MGSALQPMRDAVACRRPDFCERHREISLKQGLSHFFRIFCKKGLWVMIGGSRSHFTGGAGMCCWGAEAVDWFSGRLD